MLSFESSSIICSIPMQEFVRFNKQRSRFDFLFNNTTLQSQELTTEDIQLGLQLMFFPKVIEDAGSNMPNTIAII